MIPNKERTVYVEDRPEKSPRDTPRGHTQETGCPKEKQRTMMGTSRSSIAIIPLWECDALEQQKA